MSINHRTLSEVRAESPFVTPPRVLVVADDDNAGEALALAEALDAYGAEAEVRLTEDTTADEYGHPDAVIFSAPMTRNEGRNYRAAGGNMLLVAVADGDTRMAQARGAGFDLVVSRAMSAKTLMEKLSSRLSQMKP